MTTEAERADALLRLVVVSPDDDLVAAVTKSCCPPHFEVRNAEGINECVGILSGADAVVADHRLSAGNVALLTATLRHHYHGAIVLVMADDTDETFVAAISAGAQETLGLDRCLAGAHDIAAVVRRGILRRPFDRSHTLLSILRDSADGVILLDTQRNIMVFNPAAERIYGRRAAEVVGAPAEVLAPEMERGRQQDHLGRLLSGEVLGPQVAVRQKGDGTLIDVEFTGSPIRNGQGEITGAWVMVRDVTDDRRAREQLHFLATRDPLTGVLNRRAFADELQARLDASAHAPSRGSLLMIDLDHFKQHNDAYGHAAGDELLSAVAGAVQSNVRAHDLVGRLGGDEFVVHVVDGETKEADAVAARLVEEVRAAAGALTPDGGAAVTASIGVVAIAPDASDAFAVLDLADRAMYDAKDAGRDRWTRR